MLKLINKELSLFLFISVIFMAIVFQACTIGDDGDMLDAPRGINTDESNDYLYGDGDGGDGAGEGPKPNLAVVSITMPEKMYENNVYDVTAKIKNIGTSTTQTFKVSIHGNPADNDIDSTYFTYSYWHYSRGSLLGEANVIGLDENEEKDITVSVTIPSCTSSLLENEMAYIGAWIDYENSIDESDEDNNKGGYDGLSASYQVGDALKITTIEGYKPDITISLFNPASSYSFNDSTTVPVTVINNGPKGTTSVFKINIHGNPADNDIDSTYFTYSYWHYSRGSLLGEANVIGLDSEEQKIINVPIIIPADNSNIDSGDSVYIGVWVDVDNNIDELSGPIDSYHETNQNLIKGGYNYISDSYEVSDFLKIITIN